MPTIDSTAQPSSIHGSHITFQHARVGRFHCDGFSTCSIEKGSTACVLGISIAAQPDPPARSSGPEAVQCSHRGGHPCLFVSQPNLMLYHSADPDTLSVSSSCSNHAFR